MRFLGIPYMLPLKYDTTIGCIAAKDGEKNDPLT
jgi:hypothetical protein